MDILNLQPPTIEWRVYRNDTTNMTVVLTDANGAALDLTDWSFESDVREFPTSAEPITTMTITKDDNALTLELDTEDLTLISYFDIQGTNSVTNKVATILRGQIFIEEDITR